MPYTGLPNPDVMTLVTNGGRLGMPPGCPSVIYKIMADCWNPTPEDRPTFASLLSRLQAVTEVSSIHFRASIPRYFSFFWHFTVDKKKDKKIMIN